MSTESIRVETSNRKQSVNARLRKAAAKQLREKGPDGISVKSVMAQEGMTVGGFYAHFDSKEALVVAALKEAFAQSYAQAPEREIDLAYLKKFLRRYLSEAHRDMPGYSCPIASLATDMPRQSDTVRAVYQEGLQALVSELAKGLPHLEAQAEQLAISMASMAIGGLQLARAVPDADYSKQILENCLTSLMLLLESQQ